MIPIRAKFPAAGCCLAATLIAGCGHKAETKTSAGVVKPVPISVAEIVHRPVERTVDVVGSLKGMEEVTLGAKKSGRVIKVHHDIGDRVNPGDVLVELDPIDAQLAVDQAKSRFLGELVKLGITEQQAEAQMKKYGISQDLLQGVEVDKAIVESAGVRQTIVAVEKAFSNLERQRKINARGMGSAQDLQNLENDFRAAEASRDYAISTARNVIASALTSKVALDVADRALIDMTITAPMPSARLRKLDQPITYALTRRQVSEGQWVREGDPIMDVIVEDPLRLWANIPERYTTEIAVGQAVRVQVASNLGEPFPGKVSRINPSVDPISRTFQVESTIPNPKRLLRPGGFAKAQIITKTDSEATIVPLEAVVKFAGVTKVFLVEGKKVRSIPVVTGLEGKDWVEVTGDLPSRGEVVVSGQSVLADGTLIELRKKPEPTPEVKTASE